MERSVHENPIPQSRGTLDRQHQALREIAHLRETLDALPILVVILNSQRQIVYYNNFVTEMTASENQRILGLSPGELLNCSHGACGSGLHCPQCGTLQSIIGAQNGVETTGECRINVRTEKAVRALHLRVRSKPIFFGGESYTIFSVLDVTDAMRRRQLERVFFHDVINTANGARGMVEIARTTTERNEAHEYLEIAEKTLDQLIEEINGHRQILAAERAELAVHPQRVHFGDLCREMAAQYTEMGQHRSVTITCDGSGAMIETDPALLKRVIGNMIRNAVEASHKGDVVRVRCDNIGNAVECSVHNRAVIPAESQGQIFQRSFSTKGEGRGLGCYSMKLFGEYYLGGKMSFSSEPATGTTFRLRLPVRGEIGPPD